MSSGSSTSTNLETPPDSPMNPSVQWSATQPQFAKRIRQTIPEERSVSSWESQEVSSSPPSASTLSIKRSSEQLQQSAGPRKRPRASFPEDAQTDDEIAAGLTYLIPKVAMQIGRDLQQLRRSTISRRHSSGSLPRHPSSMTSEIRATSTSPNFDFFSGPTRDSSVDSFPELQAYNRVFPAQHPHSPMKPRHKELSTSTSTQSTEMIGDHGFNSPEPPNTFPPTPQSRGSAGACPRPDTTREPRSLHSPNPDTSIPISKPLLTRTNSQEISLPPSQARMPPPPPPAQKVQPSTFIVSSSPSIKLHPVLLRKQEKENAGRKLKSEPDVPNRIPSASHHWPPNPNSVLQTKMRDRGKGKEKYDTSAPSTTQTVRKSLGMTPRVSSSKYSTKRTVIVAVPKAKKVEAIKEEVDETDEETDVEEQSPWDAFSKPRVSY